MLISIKKAMISETLAATSPGFGYTPDQLNRYIEASGIFTILLKNGLIVHHNPDDAETFRYWLSFYKVIDIRTQS